MNTCKRAAAAVVAAGALMLVAAVIAFGIPSALAAPKGIPYVWQNCTHVHTKYRHGVGRANAYDHTRSGRNPVTNFYRSTRLYNIAMSYNKARGYNLDRDKDGIACEAH